MEGRNRGSIVTVQQVQEVDLKRLVLCALLLAASALAAGVAGNWKGNAYRADGTPSMEVVLMLKETDGKVAGTVGPSEDEQVPISNSKLDGEKLYFEVVTDNGVYKVNLTASADGLKGSAVRTLDGQDSPPMKVELKRAK